MISFRQRVLATVFLGLAAGPAVSATTSAGTTPGGMPAPAPVLPAATPIAPAATSAPEAPPAPAPGGNVTAVPATTPSANLLAHHGFVYQTRHKGEDTLGILQIQNSGGTPDVLTAWSCPLADQTALVSGSGNQPVKQIDIPADGTVKLTAAGEHLVLRNIHFEVQRGSMVPCALTFQNAGLVGVMLYAMPDPRHKPNT